MPCDEPDASCSLVFQSNGVLPGPRLPENIFNVIQFKIKSIVCMQKDSLINFFCC